MNIPLLREKLIKAVIAIDANVDQLNKACRLIREAKSILRSDQPGGSFDGMIMSLDKKLDTLMYCFEHEAYEDVVGICLDLMKFAANRVVDKQDAIQYIQERMKQGFVEVLDGSPNGGLITGFNQEGPK